MAERRVSSGWGGRREEPAADEVMPTIQVPVLLLVPPEALRQMQEQITAAVADAVRLGFAQAAEQGPATDEDFLGEEPTSGR